MQIGNLIIYPWNRKNTIPRIIAIGLILAWVIWGITIFQEGEVINQRLQAVQQQEMQKQERARRMAAYQQAQEQSRKQPRTRNAVDALK
jgi:DNA segregation ATPase FtsK/SpoIIIE-like protein